MIWTLYIMIKSFFQKRKEKSHKIPRFKVGDEVLIKNYNREGIILEITSLDTIDWYYYQVEYYPTKGHEKEGFSHIHYFFEKELDIPLREKRDRRLKELGI